MHAWVDGQLLADPEAPALPVTDHGVTVGDGVFEAVKVVEGRPFALGRHLDRMAGSARGMGLPEPDRAAVEEGVRATLAAEHLPLGRLRITMTGGAAPLGSGRHDDVRTSLLVVASPMAPATPTAEIVTAPWPRNERGPLAGIKTTSYAENVLCLDHAHRHGAGEAVLANLVGHLCEGTGSNVFYVVDGELRTPTLAGGCLAGVTRALVLEWVGGREVDEPIGVAARADEVFLVSTTRDVQPVVRWDDRTLEPGPVTAAAARVWRSREPELLGR